MGAINEKTKKRNGTLWYVSAKGKKNGPFRLDEICKSLKSGGFNVDNLVWRAGMNDWYRILDVAEFREIVREVAPDKLTGQQTSFLKEKLVCPNCFTSIPVTALKCPACELVLKKQRTGFTNRVQKESWHFRFSFLGGMVMLLSLFFPWIELSKDLRLTGYGLSIFYVHLGFGLMIVTFSVQNLLLKNKRNLVIWLNALASLMILLMFSADVLERKQQILQNYVNTDVLVENTSETPEILGIGVFVNAAGALIVLIALTLPMFFGLIQRPVGSIGMILLALLIFLSYIQLMNGNAYKFILSWQLRLKGYEIIDMNRIYNEQDSDINKTATFEVFAKKAEEKTQSTDKVDNANSESVVNYYYGVKSVRFGTIGALANLKLSRVKSEDFSLYPEFTKNATEDANESN